MIDNDEDAWINQNDENDWMDQIGEELRNVPELWIEWD
jgi:hypothetical protein